MPFRMKLPIDLSVMMNQASRIEGVSNEVYAERAVADAVVDTFRNVVAGWGYQHLPHDYGKKPGYCGSLARRGIQHWTCDHNHRKTHVAVACARKKKAQILRGVEKRRRR